jgi:hypothetical protein
MMMLVRTPRLEFLQCIDMALINAIKGSLCKRSILVLTSMPFTQGTVNLIMSAALSSTIHI